MSGTAAAMAVVGLGLAVWFGWPAADAAPAALDGPPAPAAALPAAAAGAAAAPDAAAAAAAPAREAAPVAAAGAGAAASTLLVRVVDAATKAPVPGAEVRWAGDAAWLQLATLPAAEREPLDNDQEALLVRFGERTAADADGRVRLVAEGRNVLLVARADHRFGSLVIAASEPPPAGGHQLQLEADHTLRARVLDARGQPRAGVPLTVRCLDADGKPAAGIGWIPPAMSGDGGIAELRHTQAWLRPAGGRRQVAVHEWRLALGMPGYDDPGVPFDPDAPPAEPIELRLPPSGALRIGVWHQGRQVTEGVRAKVWRGGENDTRQQNLARDVPADAAGWVRIAPVALGGELVVAASLGTADLTRTVAAPRGDGEEVRVEFTTEGLYVLTGTLLGPDGEPLRDQTVSIEFDLQVIQGSGAVTTDAQGRFTWFLTQGYRDPAELRRLVFSQRPADASPLRAAVAPRTFGRGVTDLGVLRLQAGALVVAGAIAADGPPPHGDWWLVVEALADRRGRDGAERWEQVQGLVQSVQADGRFEFRGDTRPGRHRLRLPGPHHLPVAPVEFLPGEAKLRVQVQLGHPLRAEVRLPDPAFRRAVTGRLRPRFAPPPESEADELLRGEDRYTARLYGALAQAAVLRWQGLPAGTYDLDLLVRGFPTPLATVTEVVVPAPAGGDPRLSAIDLDGTLRTVSLEVSFAAAAAGASRPQVLVFPQPQADPQQWWGLDLDPAQPLAVPREAGEVLVCARGHQPARVALAGERLAVELQPWPATAVAFTDLPPLPDGVSLRLYAAVGAAPGGDRAMYRTDQQGGPLPSLLQPDGGSAEVRDGRAMLVLGDGPFRLSAYLVRTAKAAPAAPVKMTLGGSGSIALPETGRRPVPLRTLAPSEGIATGAPLVVRVDAAELQAAIASLQAGR